MSEDLRNSMKLWAGGVAAIVMFWVLLHSDLLDGVSENVPPDWFWLVIGVLAILNLGQFAWGLWQRRASKSR